jgi:hypothetical protein
LETVPPSHRRYSSDLFVFAKTIHDISLSAYILVRSHIRSSPHPNYLRSHANSFPDFRGETYLELAGLPEVVEGWKQAHNLASNVTAAEVVAVDAISFKEHFSICRTGETREMTISDAKISGEEWDHLVQNVHEFEALFTSVFQDQILCAAFVFQFQPIDQNLGDRFVRTVPSHTSKASPSIVTRLEEVVHIYGSQNLRVIVQSFDGDRSYHRYHVDIIQHAREIMARPEQICTELSDRKGEDEREMPTADDDRGSLSRNRGEEAN